MGCHGPRSRDTFCRKKEKNLFSSPNHFLQPLINSKLSLLLNYCSKSTLILDLLSVSKGTLHRETYISGTKK